MRSLRWCVALLCATAAVAHAQERGYMLRDTDMRARPFLDAPNVSKLAEKSMVTVLERQGGWLQVKTDSAQGWVRLLSVRLGNPDPARNDTSIASVFGGARPQRSATNATVTTGVRGFSEEDLKAAEPNPEEVKKMEAFATGIDAAAFAQAGKLAGQEVPYVDAKGRPEGGKK